MGKGPQDDLKSCPKCGAFYLNFCVHCKKRGIEERVWELLGKHELNEDNLIRILAEKVREGNFPALNLAIALRDMKPSEKHEVDLNEGSKVNDAKDRIAALLSRLPKPKPAD